MKLKGKVFLQELLHDPPTAHEMQCDRPFGTFMQVQPRP